MQKPCDVNADFDLAATDEEISINISGPVHLAVHFVPYLKVSSCIRRLWFVMLMSEIRLSPQQRSSTSAADLALYHLDLAIQCTARRKRMQPRLC